MEFWSELITEKSWKKLIELNKRFEFVVIGGWAAWLWTGLHKSKDIDIVVEYSELEKIKQEENLKKNDRLKKYEIKLEDVDVDIYLPYYSKLALPVEKILKEKRTVKGIKTVSPEALLVLKQGAEIDRRNSIKGEKDAIDILTLLIYTPIEIERYLKIIKEEKKEEFKKELLHVINNFDLKQLKYLNLNVVEFKKWKEEFKKKIIALA